ncbi:MgtC/SapB family protein [Paramagnetospirillum magneticum]|nr:MgtC/SapB family protein [Paramagnetospirillum magneticum]
MNPQHLEIALHLGSAWAAGSLVGAERSFHGRPAGFRTHALVCVASALLMLVTVYQWEWLGVVPLETVRTDPTRMAQGIMTGIGFLGAGVIFKEGLTVRGLTTAASIWMTAALGILFGIGFYYPALLATGVTVATLALFRMVEYRMPSQFYAHHLLRFARDRAMPEGELRGLIQGHGFTISNMSYRLCEGGDVFEYKMVIRTADRDNVERLVEGLRGLADVLEFRVSPTGD